MMNGALTRLSAANLSEMHQVCFSREVDLDQNEMTSDTCGLYTYLMSCRKNKVRPSVLIAQQVCHLIT